MNMEMIHGLLKTYVTTLTRVVGPTTLVGKRGTLPVSSPNDADCIWLAMNGNDANPGTEASPKREYEGGTGAVASLTTHKCVHVFRNGYVGPLVFTVSSIVALGTSYHVQVEEGEIATLEHTGGATRTDCSGSNRFNGIALTALVPSGPLLKTVGNSWLSLENCDLITGNSIGIDWDNVSMQAAVRLEHTFFKSKQINVPTNSNTHINNSVLIHFSETPFVAERCLVLKAPFAAAQTITITRSIFYGFSDFPVLIDDNTQVTAGNAHTLEYRSCVVWKSDYLVAVKEAAAGTAYYKMNYNNSLLIPGVADVKISELAGDAIIITTNDTRLDETLPRMYVDESAGIAGDVNGFRLQIEGKQTPDGGGRYFLSSPLAGAGVSGEDVAPFDETTTGPTLAWEDATEIVWPPRKLQISANPINPVEVTDVRGSYHNMFDGIRREFSFQFEAYANNENARKLVKVMADKGSVKLYLKGQAGHLFTDASAGHFDSTDNSFAPSSGLGYMIPANWQGFWVEFDGEDYYIERNDATKFYLVDKLGVGFPSTGVYDFAVRYILVQARRAPITMNQDNFTEFALGGTWREKADTQSAAFEYDGFAVTFLETEDPVENA